MPEQTERPEIPACAAIQGPKPRPQRGHEVDDYGGTSERQQGRN